MENEWILKAVVKAESEPWGPGGFEGGLLAWWPGGLEAAWWPGRLEAWRPGAQNPALGTESSQIQFC